MKCFLISGALLFSLVAMASPKITSTAVESYDLDIELSLSGKTVFTPHMIVKRGQKGRAVQTFNNGQNFIEVIADESSNGKNKKIKNGIFMKFTVGVIEQDGAHKILEQPQIIALENQRAEVVFAAERDKESVSVAVVAKRNPASVEDEPSEKGSEPSE